MMPAMPDQPLYPLQFAPIFQYRLWGGRALGAFMGCTLPGQGPIGEAWILSDRADCASRITNGALAGQTLGDIMQQRKADILGRHAGRFDRFPLLLKFLDVAKMLSVQVHPRDDQTALIPAGDTGKTEAWVVLRTQPGARIFAGLMPGTTAHDLAGLTAANAGRALHSFAPQPGQAVLIAAGTVHALGGGVVVFEVQENSDTTFRLFDWDHIDPTTGRRRDLQVDQALASVNFAQGPIGPVAHDRPVALRQVLLTDPHFQLVRWQGDTGFAVGAPGEPRVLVCAEGRGHVISQGVPTPMQRGDVVLLPASLGRAGFNPDGPATILELAIPDDPNPPQPVPRGSTATAPP